MILDELYLSRCDVEVPNIVPFASGRINTKISENVAKKKEKKSS